MEPADRILTVNGASSAVKFAICLAGELLKRSLYGTVDRIGLTGTTLTFRDADGKENGSVITEARDHKSAAVFLVDWIESQECVRDLLAREGRDFRAAEAVDLFCHQAKKWIGAFAAALGGVDTLVFAGGIGENAPVVRERICEGLGFLGIEVSAPRNAQSGGVISTDASRITIRVIPTD